MKTKLEEKLKVTFDDGEQKVIINITNLVDGRSKLNIECEPEVKPNETSLALDMAYHYVDLLSK